MKTSSRPVRARRVCVLRPRRSGPGESDGDIREEIARIERAILQGAVQILEEFGGLEATLKRSVALTTQARRQAVRGSIQRGRTWQTVRLSGALPMTAVRLMAVPACENDVGGRCTL